MEYSLSLSEQELSILSAALVELPFKVAAPLVAKINQQITVQQKENKQKPASAPSGASSNNL